MTTYFSVDIETTGTSASTGRILTIGAYAGEELEFYSGCKAPTEKRFQDPGTMNWWKEQTQEVVEEAFFWRQDEHSLLVEFQIWVEITEPEIKQRCFVANPAAFDFSMINDAFLRHGLANPFGYRALCLRSMRFAYEPEEWGLSRSEKFASKIPHHALEDARAQWLDLQELLEMRKDYCG